MNRKSFTTGVFILTAAVLFLCLAKQGSGMEEPDDPLESFREVNEFVEENEACFSCHAETKYKLPGSEYDRIATKHMSTHYQITREEYYKGNHKSFACWDCHSADYETFPHPLEARLEEPWGCLDCHGYDEDYAHFQFEKIEEEYLQSVHYLRNPDEFSCWKCHPHSYHINIRTTDNIKETVAYDNSICLSCHADFNRFELLTDREGIEILETHDWLPNQELHFASVRCIECHTKISDSILVAHLVQPKELAVKNCGECHSRNSILMATLYKHEAKEARDKFGFINAVVMNDAFVIGANRNYYLNLISLIIFGLTFLGIAVHILFRIIKKV